MICHVILQFELIKNIIIHNANRNVKQFRFRNVP